MTAPVEFKDFGKIARLRTVTALVTEKIDGTNAQIYVPEDPAEPVLAGSRNRWVTPTSDNYGFAAFVYEHAEVFRRLGPGRHFGEWYGAGIGRRYGLDHKRLALFNVDRYAKSGLPEGLPATVELVPVLYRGAFDSAAISDTIERLYTSGSVAVAGFDKPEGVIVQVGPLRWKVTDNGDAHKGCTTDHGEVVRAAAAEDRAKRDREASPLADAMRAVTVERHKDGSFLVSSPGHELLSLTVLDSSGIAEARRQLATQIVALGSS